MDFISSYLNPIEKELNRLFNGRSPSSLYEPCRYFLRMGGKRIRPVLTQIGCGICEGNLENSLQAALSIELIHNFTLVHDDIMDDADTRRGQPSVHQQWDVATAILSGDILFADAMERLQSYPPDMQSILNATLLRSIRSVCEGQARDLEMERQTDATVEDYFEMIRGKTAALISGALVMGGVVANAEEKQLNALERIGEILGLSFQIQDDLMDVTADPEQFGKRRGGDILEKKKTYLLLLARDRASEQERSVLDQLFRKNELDESDVEEVIELFHTTGAIQSARDEIRSGYQTALTELNQFGESSYKQDLAELVNQLTHRES